MMGVHDLKRIIQRMIDPLINKIRLSIGRCIIAVVDDTKMIQEIKATLLDKEVRDGMQRYQEYGFTSNPLPGATGVVVFPGGDRSQGLIIACEDRRYRLKGLESGEVALYTDEGDYIHFQRDRKIRILTRDLEITATEKFKVISPDVDFECTTFDVAATEKATFTTPEHEITGNETIGGDTQVDGDVHADGDITSDKTVTGATDVVTPAGGGISLTEIQTDYNSHTHNYTDDGNPMVTSVPNSSV